MSISSLLQAKDCDPVSSARPQASPPSSFRSPSRASEEMMEKMGGSVGKPLLQLPSENEVKDDSGSTKVEVAIKVEGRRAASAAGEREAVAVMGGKAE
jgi:hypothetical protein